jgi:hypothetical protein
VQDDDITLTKLALILGFLISFDLKQAACSSPHRLWFACQAIYAECAQLIIPDFFSDRCSDLSVEPRYGETATVRTLRTGYAVCLLCKGLFFQTTDEPFFGLMQHCLGRFMADLFFVKVEEIRKGCPDCQRFYSYNLGCRDDRVVSSSVWPSVSCRGLSRSFPRYQSPAACLVHISSWR